MLCISYSCDNVNPPPGGWLMLSQLPAHMLHNASLNSALTVWSKKDISLALPVHLFKNKARYQVQISRTWRGLKTQV